MRRSESVKREGMLRDLYKVYVAPTSGSVQKFQATHTSFGWHRKAASPLARTLHSFQPLSAARCVTHQNVIYPSAESSRCVLSTNRQTYREMILALRQMEATKYQESSAAVKALKRKYQYFRERSRQHTRPGCN